MKDVYVEKFSQVLDDISMQTGTYLSPYIHSYLSSLLADHVEKTKFFVEPFAFRYMSLNNSTSAKELGDNCLILVGVFPGYRGMNNDYYVNIGAGSYGVAASATGSEIFDTLSKDFDNLRGFLNYIRPHRYF